MSRCPYCGLKYCERIDHKNEHIAALEAERDDYKDRWEQTGCTRHEAMEAAIRVKDSVLKRLDAAESFARSVWTGEGGLNDAFDQAWKEALGADDE